MVEFEQVFPDLDVTMDSGKYEVIRISDVVDEEEYRGDVVINAQERFSQRSQEFENGGQQFDRTG